MEEAKTRNLYADLGLADNWASVGEIDLAHMELMSKLDPEVNPAAAPADAAELSKVESAYKILRDPEKRAEYNRTRTDLFKHNSQSKIWRKHKAAWKSPLDQMLRVARLQLESKAWQHRRTRRLPRNTQLRAKAQLRAHAYHLDLFHALSRSHGDATALRHVGLGPVEEVPQYWAVFDPTEREKTMKEEKHHRTRSEARERALAAILTRRADIKEAEDYRRRAAAYEKKPRAEEIKWINQEAKDSILRLARMAQHPVPELAGHDLRLYKQDVRQKVDKAVDLLDFLAGKICSGTWAIPNFKEGLDLGLILRSVMQPKSVKSWHFEGHVQDLAAILLDKVPSDEGN